LTFGVVTPYCAGSTGFAESPRDSVAGARPHRKWRRIPVDRIRCVGIRQSILFSEKKDGSRSEKTIASTRLLGLYAFAVQGQTTQTQTDDKRRVEQEV
jgi:hypothetical protein